MKKIAKICTLLGAVTFLLASCATTKADGNQSSGAKIEKKADKKKKKSGKYDQDAFDSAFSAGDYDTCIKMLDSRKSDSILTHIDSYMLLYLKKDYLASGKEINQTQANMNNVTKGMTAAKTVEAALAGENSVEYYGSPYERLLTYSMKALNNLKAGSVSGAKGVMDDYTGNYKDVVSALVQEQKKVNAMSYSDKIDSANANLKKAGLAAFDLSKISSSDKGYKPSDEIYETSVFLSYLGALIYSAYGDSAHASDMALTLNNTRAADILREDITVPSGKGRLDVIALTDLIGKRTEYSSELTNMGVIGDATVWFKIAYPVFVEQNHPIAVKSVSLSTGESKSFTLIEDFDKAVEMDVRSRQKGARNRSIARNVIKNSAAAVAGYAALESAQQALDKASNPIAQKAAVAGYDAAKIALNEGLKAVTDAEKADVRQGLFFPHKASAAGFTVGPGTYSVTVEYTDGTSNVIKDVVVSAGKPTIVVSENMKKSGI